MQIFATDAFVLPLPPGHRFPMDKYARLRARVEAAGLGSMHVPPAATREQLALAHTADYVERVQAGTLTAKELRELGFPWSPAMVERSLRSTGATISACRAALQDGLAVNLAGGTHHAFADRAEGYCVFNDSAVAARVMQAEGRVRQVVILDCDVHQGNGTAAILADDPSDLHPLDPRRPQFPVHQATQRPRHPPARRHRRRRLPRRARPTAWRRRSSARAPSWRSSSPAPTRTRATASAASR